jgi:hypothetical protein
MAMIYSPVARQYSLTAVKYRPIAMKHCLMDAEYSPMAEMYRLMAVVHRPGAMKHGVMGMKAGLLRHVLTFIAEREAVGGGERAERDAFNSFGAARVGVTNPRAGSFRCGVPAGTHAVLLFFPVACATGLISAVPLGPFHWTAEPCSTCPGRIFD